MAGDLKNQHLLQRQPVAKNHIIDGLPCSNKDIDCGPTPPIAEIIYLGQKSEGNWGLWVLNEMIKKTYPGNSKKIVGAV